MRTFADLALSVALVFTLPLRAWNGTGHMVVAYMAYKNLTPKTRARVDVLIKMNPMYGAWTSGVPDADRGLVAYLNAATWPDCIKTATACPGYHPDGTDRAGENPAPGSESSQNIGYADKAMHKYWHYIDEPYATGGAHGADPKVPNARTEIVLLVKAISTSESDTIKSYDLVWLTHLVGDVHQPLHCASRFTKNHPHGDTGGNDVVFCVKPCRDELHAYWDDLLGTKTDLKTVTRLGDALLERGRPQGAKETSVTAWINESFELAKKYAYAPPITDDNDLNVSVSPRPDPQYRAAARKVAQTQVRLAGYRLAALLEANLR